MPANLLTVEVKLGFERGGVSQRLIEELIKKILDAELAGVQSVEVTKWECVSDLPAENPNEGL